MKCGGRSVLWFCGHFDPALNLISSRPCFYFVLFVVVYGFFLKIVNIIFQVFSEAITRVQTTFLALFSWHSRGWFVFIMKIHLLCFTEDKKVRLAGMRGEAVKMFHCVFSIHIYCILHVTFIMTRLAFQKHFSYFKLLERRHVLTSDRNVNGKFIWKVFCLCPWSAHNTV